MPRSRSVPRSPSFSAPVTVVVTPLECQSNPRTHPNAWNQYGSARRRSTSSRPYSSTIWTVISRASRTIREKSHAGARPPCSGSCADPVLTIQLCQDRMLFYGAVPPSTRIAGPSWALAAALLITAFAALLRLDAFTGKYGELDHPAWARAATHDLAPLARPFRPHLITWQRFAVPYVGGDPISYLRYAREMTSFY